MNQKTKIVLSVTIPVSVILVSLLTLTLFNNKIHESIYKDFVAPTPIISSSWKQEINNSDIIGDYYVSTTGDDSNRGSKDAPFKTIEKAKEQVRLIAANSNKDIVICIEEGEYPIDNLTFTNEDSGNEHCQIIYKGLGNVVFNGGVQLLPTSFKSVSYYPDIATRLNKSAQEHAKVLDLSQAGISKDEIGKMYAYGTYNTSAQYEGDTTGPIFAEIFINEKRMNLARYPNEGYINTDEVVFSSRDKNIALPNGDPKGDIYKINNNLANRIKGWKTINDVWMYGFFMYDWADQATSILSFDKTTNELETKYYSFFGIKKDAPYYFYNCLEELDSPGEYYIDRENNLLIVYETDDFNSSKIEISISTNPVIKLDANYLTLDNIKITGSRDMGIYSNGFNHHCNITNCKIFNVGGGGMMLLSNDCNITHNEIYEVGSYGIGLQAGDKNSLTKGNVVVSNNLIHGYQKISKVLGAAIQTYGSGFLISNNEIYDGNHTGIHYSGIYHVIENNVIHDVCKESDDSGAIYAGRSWTSYGNIIRNNLIYNLGSNNHFPNGIYLDDALSGQIVYGNLLINIPSNGLFLGGGRDLKIYDNIVINAGKNAILYDARAREGLQKETFFSSHVKDDGDMWLDLKDCPWKSEAWQEAFPEYKDLIDDMSNIDSPYFFPNPASSVVNNNLIFDKKLSVGEIHKDVKKYSDIKNNIIKSPNALSQYFMDYKNGDYHLSDSKNNKNCQYVNLNNVGMY